MVEKEQDNKHSIINPQSSDNTAEEKPMIKNRTYFLKNSSSFINLKKAQLGPLVLKKLKDINFVLDRYLNV